MNVEVRDFDVKGTAAELRKALRTAFPGVKFSVWMSRGTGYGWLHAEWTDGPTADQVRQITNRFRDSYFDGQDDSYHRIESTLYARDDGTLYEPRYSCCGVNTQRRYSSAAELWAEKEYTANGHRYHTEWQVLQTTDLTNGVPVVVDDEQPRA